MTTRKPLSLQVRDFSGGLNLRDAPSELAGKYSPDLWNVSLDERGGVVSRLGYQKWNSSSYGAAPPSNLFYWSTPNHTYVQVGASLYQDLVLTPIKTFTTSARCAMADFAGKLCIVHPVDGMFTYDGAAIAAVAAGPKADSLAVWQNKLWANDKSGTNPARVNFCAAGDPTTWATFNDIRENDNAQVVNVFATAGSDIVGRPTLLAFKLRSSYRIYDSTTGAYQTLDGRIGTAGALSVTAPSSKVLTLSNQGIFETDGVGPLKEVSDQLRPLWSNTQLNVPQMSLAAAGAFGTHAYFSVPRAGSSANNLMLDYDASTGAFTANSNAASCYAVHFDPTVNVLLSGSPTVNGQLYAQLLTGADDGTPISSYYRTPWFELASSARCRLPNLRINGRGTFTTSVYRDYTTASPITRSVAITPASGIAGWAPDLHSLGVGRAFSVRVDASTSSTFTTPAMLGGATQSVGALALYELGFYPIALGLR